MSIEKKLLPFQRLEIKDEKSISCLDFFFKYKYKTNKDIYKVFEIVKCNNNSCSNKYNVGLNDYCVDFK